MPHQFQWKQEALSFGLKLNTTDICVYIAKEHLCLSQRAQYLYMYILRV